MRIHETCSCGGSIEVVLDGLGNTYGAYPAQERKANECLEKFRRRHKDCGKPAKEAA